MTDVLVLGAGTVGAAIACGLARQSCRVTLLDSGDADHRAVHGNFGVVWLQGKGAGTPAYRRLTRQSVDVQSVDVQSVDVWPGFGEEFAQVTGAALSYEPDSGPKFCLSEQEWDMVDRGAYDLRSRNRELGKMAQYGLMDLEAAWLMV